MPVHVDAPSFPILAVRPQGQDRRERARPRWRDPDRACRHQNPDDSVRQQNPLGKIPALVLEDGTVLFDSRVILEYLDHRAGGGRIIPTRRERAFRCAAPAGARRRHHGCVGPAGLRGTLAAAREARAEVGRSPGRQGRARARGARSRAARRSMRRRDVGQIALACALGYRDFRFAGTLAQGSSAPGRLARRVRPRVPAFAATKPPGRAERGSASRPAENKAPDRGPGLWSCAHRSVIRTGR